MSIRVAATWELGWDTPIREVEMWRFMLNDFGVEKFYMTPVSGIKNKHVTEKHFFREILEENRPTHQLIFVDERAETPLSKFVHPENALYIFGKAGFSPWAAYKQEEDLDLLIDTTFVNGGLWPHQCAAIILYDRIHKWH